MKRGTYLVFNDSFGVKHVGITTGSTTDNNGRVIGVLILKSLGESNLNTANIYDENIELILEGKWDSERINSIEEEMPEIWL